MSKTLLDGFESLCRRFLPDMIFQPFDDGETEFDTDRRIKCINFDGGDFQVFIAHYLDTNEIVAKVKRDEKVRLYRGMTPEVFRMVLLDRYDYIEYVENKVSIIAAQNAQRRTNFLQTIQGMNLPGISIENENEQVLVKLCFSYTGERNDDWLETQKLFSILATIS